MQSKAKILLIDDDKALCAVLSEYLELEGYEVDSVLTAKAAIRRVSEEVYDILLVDLKLPDADGMDLVIDFRAQSEAGIIVLTGSTHKADKIVGLEQGADDYVQKPFDQRELLARIRSVMRRRGKSYRSSPKQAGHKRAVVGNWQVDLVAREVRGKGGDLVPLTSTEFELFALFVSRANHVISRDKICDAMAFKSWNPKDRSIDVTVSKLRKKLEEEGGESCMIKTVRGSGYILAAEVNQS